MKTYIHLHRVNIIQAKPGDIFGNTFKSEQKPDAYAVEDIAGIQQNVFGFAAILIPGVGSIPVKETASEIFEMIQLADL